MSERMVANQLVGFTTEDANTIVNYQIATKDNCRYCLVLAYVYWIC